MLRCVLSLTANCLIYLFDWLAVFLPITMVKNITDYCHIINRDVRFMLKAAKGIRRSKNYIKNDITIIDEFEKNVKEHPDKICFYHEDVEWTFRDVELYSNRVCNAIGSSFNKGDVIAVMLPNCPEYASVWLGLCKSGVISALINTNVRKKPLLHCINIAKAKAIIYSNQYDSALSDILDDIEGTPLLYCLEGESKLTNSFNLPQLLKTADISTVSKRPSKFNDVVIYIYTSGTTGLPKPAKVTHSKLIGLAMTAELAMGLRSDDIMYSPMPMYHTAGTTVVVCGYVIGPTVAIKTKFSASTFISDCRKYNATVAVYIGEMIRYVVNTEEKPTDKDHKLRIVAGNGLRAEVWRKFVKRFHIPNLTEYYGSTEGNFLLVNANKTVGSCGYLPIGIPYYYLTGPSLIKMDEETGEPIRGKDGLCIRAEPGEPGLCIGYCPSGNEMRKFHGYLSEKDTDSKRIRNVYKQGDMAFNTGDLLVMDDRGWLTFIDRLGDTFRWKGENVSTAEVEAILNSSPDVEESAVYGVQIGSLEGKAGMASVIMKSSDLDNLSKFLDFSLPTYARPLFIRLVESLQHTGTFKVIKVQLKKEGFDINIVKDPLYVRIDGKFTPITQEMYDKIQGGSVKM